MQHLKTLARLQRYCTSSYCCRRHLTENVPHDTGTVPDVPHDTGTVPSVPPSLAGRVHPNKHVTPASELSSIYQEPYNQRFKELFGDKKALTSDKEKVNFSDFKALHPILLEQLRRLGFEKPLPVQLQTLNATLKGKDAVIKSVTGSGKTLAFVLPLLNKIGPQRVEGGRRPQAVIVAPTRELCRQISKVVEDFIGDRRLINMIGGQLKVRKQAKNARADGRDIIIATPGRAMQLVSMNIIRPEELKFLVLDEADELLHDVFYRHVRWILDNSNPSKQMIVTTATVPSNVQFVIDRYMKYHEYIDLGDSAVSLPEHIKHKAVLYEIGVFRRALGWVLKNEHRSCSMVFVKYKDDCIKVTELVRDLGYTVKYINSEVPEGSRVKAMEEFRTGKYEILVATDVAARGVDIPQCELVVHIKPDLNHTKYIHRAGRTGRAGRSGTSVLMLVHEKEEHMEFLGDLADVVKFEYYLYARLRQYRLIPNSKGNTT